MKKIYISLSILIPSFAMSAAHAVDASEFPFQDILEESVIHTVKLKKQPRGPIEEGRWFIGAYAEGNLKELDFAIFRESDNPEERDDGKRLTGLLTVGYFFKDNVLVSGSLLYDYVKRDNAFIEGDSDVDTYDVGRGGELAVRYYNMIGTKTALFIQSSAQFLYTESKETPPGDKFMTWTGRWFVSPGLAIFFTKRLSLDILFGQLNLFEYEKQKDVQENQTIRRDTSIHGLTYDIFTTRVGFSYNFDLFGSYRGAQPAAA